MQEFEIQDTHDTLASGPLLKPRSFKRQQRCIICLLSLICLLVGRLIGLRMSRPLKADEQCSVLTNEVSHYTIEIGVGTPPQLFAVVVDTGVSHLMVPSCSCVTSGKCKADRCFLENNSHTYDSIFDKYGPPVYFDITYGFTTVKASLVTDVVHLQSRHGLMPDGVLIIHDAVELNESFEGIMGLGPPYVEGLRNLGDDWRPPFVFDRLGVKRFSMCMRRNGPGALRIERSRLVDALKTVGDSGWRLRFGGISVGDASDPSLFCTGSTFPCQVVIDTGVPFFLGPHSHVRTVLINLCKEWPRCFQWASMVNQTMDVSFLSLLTSCSSWAEDPLEALDELPSIFLHFIDDRGQRLETLELPPISFTVIYRTDTDNGPWMCAPLIDYTHGLSSAMTPYWVLGLPFFFEYKVSFDLGARPAALAFSRDPCLGCSVDDSDIATIPFRSRNAGASHDLSKPWQVLGSVRTKLSARQRNWDDKAPSF